MSHEFRLLCKGIGSSDSELTIGVLGKGHRDISWLEVLELRTWPFSVNPESVLN